MLEKIKEALQTYDKFAKIYADYTFQKIPQFQLNEFISLIKGKRILDAGCGSGRDVQYFLDEGLNPLGIDSSLELIKQAKEKVPKGNFKHMDFRELNLKINEFDGVWCVASLSDLTDQDSKLALKQFQKVLKSKGVLFISVREGKGQEIIKSPRYENNPRYYNKYSIEKIRNFLQEANFQIIKSEVCEDENRKWIETFAFKQ